MVDTCPLLWLSCSRAEMWRRCFDARQRKRQRYSYVETWTRVRNPSRPRHTLRCFVLFIPPRKQLEINVVRLKSTKNLPRKCRVVMQILQPPGAKNVHFTSSWCKSCREFWSPKIRKYRFLRIRLVWASTANVACAEPLGEQQSFHSNRNISTLPPHQWEMFSLLQCRWDLISFRLQRLAASKATHSTFS